MTVELNSFYTPAIQVGLHQHPYLRDVMEKFAEFVSSIGQNARSSSYMSSSGAIPRGTTSPNVPPVSYASCDLARQHALPLSTPSQPGNYLFDFYNDSTFCPKIIAIERINLN